MQHRWIACVVATLVLPCFAPPSAPGQLPQAVPGGLAPAEPAPSNHDGGANHTPRAAEDAGAKVTGTIGFVDLDHVSALIGWRDEFYKDLDAARRDADRQVLIFRGLVVGEWDAKKKSVAGAAHLDAVQAKALDRMDPLAIQRMPLTQAQKDDLAQSFAQMNEALNRAREIAKQVLNEREQKILESFRDAMRPSVGRAATAAHFSMVIAPPPNANPIFWHDPAVDLSERVADEMRKAMPQHTLPAMPTLNLPSEFHFSTNRSGGAQAPAPAAGPGVSPASP